MVILGWTLIVIGTAMAVAGIRLRMEKDRRLRQAANVATA
jgi:hypothetical protein